MRRIICLIVILIILVGLVGCSEGPIVKENSEMTQQESIVDAKEEVVVPTEAEVLAMRKVVLENMAEDDITHLINVVKSTNLSMERDYLYGNNLENMEDPESLTWNYIDNVGEIHVGWAFNTDDLKWKTMYNLSDEEFYKQYGQRVIAYNDVNGEVFIEHMTEIKETIYNEALKKDFDALIWNMEQAIETHDVEYMYQIYRIFHDMDYFLLRYGITAMAGYVSDYSTVAKYYGVLEVYKNSKNDEA